MLRTPWKRALAAAIALTLVAALAPAAAQACSCALGGNLPAERLARGDVALIGEVVAKQPLDQPPGPGDPPAVDARFAYSVRVERAFNAELGAETLVVASSNGGTCGISWTVGQRVGAFLGRWADSWGTGSCNLVDPARLIEAAQPPPPPPTPPAPPTPPVVPDDPGRAADTPPPPPTLQARLGKRVAAGGARAGTLLERLPARADQVVRLRLDVPARSVRFALARADGKRLGGLLSASAVAGSRRLAWSARLPRVVPPRADRLLVVADLGAGRRATFAVGLGQPARGASAARALVAAGLPCPFAPAV